MFSQTNAESVLGKTVVATDFSSYCLNILWFDDGSILVLTACGCCDGIGAWVEWD